MANFLAAQRAKNYGTVVLNDLKAAALPASLVKRSKQSEAADDKLCDICEKFDFVELFSDANDESHARIILGMYDDILAKHHCPFCRLVVSAVSKSLHTPIGAGYRTVDGESVYCLLRRYRGSEQEPWRRNLKVQLRSMAVKKNFTGARMLWEIGSENDIRTDNDFVKGLVQDCDAEIIIHTDSASENRAPPQLEEENNPRVRLGLDPNPLIGRTPEPTFDFQKLHLWHQACGECSQIDLLSHDPTSTLPVDGMFLIDTTAMNTVPAPEGAAYVALSYVWGALKNPVRATKANRHELMAEGGLTKTTLPRTIHQAVEVVRAIGFRYLWVDSLCIIQDDPESQMDQIRAMDLIYKGAALTIAAAGGNCADDPLMNPERENMVHTEDFGDLKLMARNRPFKAALVGSTWDSRAWCYQEKILSRRILLFTEAEVYYNCSHFSWRESMKSADVERKLAVSQEPNLAESEEEIADHVAKETPKQDPGHIWYPLRSILQEYTLRALTNENDVLFAVWGVLKSLSPTVVDMLGGSPIPHLLFMLLWQPDGPHQRRSITKVPYPSWSWIGWIGATRFPLLFEMRVSGKAIWATDFPTSRTSIITSWYFRDCKSDQTPTHLQDALNFEHHNVSRQYPLQMVGQEEVIAKTKDLTAQQLEELQKAEIVLLKRSDEYVYALKSGCLASGLEEDIQSSPNISVIPDHGLLQFFTESAFFTVSTSQTERVKPFYRWDVPVDHSTSTCHFKILDAKENWVGSVQMPVDWEGAGKKWEFIIVSADMKKATLEEEGQLHEMPMARKLKSRMRLPGEPTFLGVYFYDVLLIEWRLGVAYRLGLGSVYFADWNVAGPVSKLITLG
ncbi:hypothetical protein G7Y89_g4747 [Cudoniella acicularis]|uniref:Heterokaryon incompatibility domain-containing protein n=1 Tax=Cudoniella acicularis TaxID=354080 RepID=A0A8H4W6D4_9HELO|nr:hypothetical protein G7Y89_g4747 [Cudoniella acicularis]